MKKKLSMILCMIMTLSLILMILPIQVLAASRDEDVDQTTDIQALIDVTSSGDTVVLNVTENITIGATITVPANKTVILQTATTASGTVEISRADGFIPEMFKVAANGTLTIENIILDGRYNKAVTDATFALIDNVGTLNLQTDAVLQYNTNTHIGTSGGGVDNYGEITMDGAIIQHCSSVTIGGGISNAGTLLMTGDSQIINCSARGGGGVHNFENAFMTMEGSTTINNNKSISIVSGDGGGGVSLVGASQLTMKGNATIHSNTAALNGGGICSKNDTFIQQGNIILSGNARVYDNQADGKGNDIYITDDNARFVIRERVQIGAHGEKAGIYLDGGSIIFVDQAGLDSASVQIEGVSPLINAHTVVNSYNNLVSFERIAFSYLPDDGYYLMLKRGNLLALYKPIIEDGGEFDKDAPQNLSVVLEPNTLMDTSNSQGVITHAFSIGDEKGDVHPLAQDQYTFDPNTQTVTLKASAMQSLPRGGYTLIIEETSDGGLSVVVYIRFVVLQEQTPTPTPTPGPTAPPTGDAGNGNGWMWMMILAAGMLGIYVVMRRMRERE